MADLIRRDPQLALSVTIPVSLRNTLPAEVANELETRVSGVGNFSVEAYLSIGNGHTSAGYDRIVDLNGSRYHAYVYGRRLGQTTKVGIPLHGIAIDGYLALHEAALRQLGSDENVATLVDLSGPAWPAAVGSPQFAVQVGAAFYRLASVDHVLEIESRLEAAEAGIGPRPHQSIQEVMSMANQTNITVLPQAPTTPWTTGTKQVLVTRMDFSDRPGPPNNMSAADIQTVMDTKTAPFFVRSSYQLTNLVTTVAPAVYRLPQTAAYYKAGHEDQLHTDAENLISAGYSLANYDRIIVFYSLNDPSSGSGLGEIGGKRVWINNYFDLSFTAHELGHTYGNWHANLWQVNDGNPISPAGSHVEYGDGFDVMGGGGYLLLGPTGSVPDYNEFFKNRLGWIADSQVINVTSSGTYRIYRFDDVSATGQLAMKITSRGHDYWIGARRAFPGNASMQNGAYIVWGWDDSRGSELLDMTTPGSDSNDVALAIGSVFADVNYGGVTIKPVAEGGTPPHQFLDLHINVNGPATGLGGISTRGLVQTGNNVLIGGITISGSGPKQLVLRAIGPTLARPPFNLPTALANPRLDLYDAASNLIASNDNWITSPDAAAIQASGYAPPNKFEPAILATLNPGSYTAIVHGVNNSTGVALIDAYDIDSNASSNLSSISTRGYVQTGNNVMIAGVTVTGQDSQNVVIRVLGPSLAQPPFKLPNVLLNPYLDLRNANGQRLMSNDNWRFGQQSEIEVLGYAPGNDSEAAILATLAPGNYTAVVSGVNNTSGNALVQVNSLPFVSPIRVPATANCWLAGQPNGTTGRYSDVAPDESPVLVTGAAVNPGSLLSFIVTGSTSNYTGPSGLTPDGGGSVEHGAENGIAGFTGNICALMGVFLGNSRPIDPPPADFAFQPNAVVISPALRQPFFIGDGRTGTGLSEVQQFRIPAGATRLFLGSLDGWDNNGNFGSFQVNVIAPTSGAAADTATRPAAPTRR